MRHAEAILSVQADEGSPTQPGRQAGSVLSQPYDEHQPARKFPPHIRGSEYGRTLHVNETAARTMGSLYTRP